MSARVTSTDYAHPFRPWPLRLANRAGELLARRGVRADLAAEGLMDAACRRQGLTRWGKLDFVAPLERLLAAVEAEARLHPLGRLITRERLIGVLGNRLRLRHTLRRAPRIATLPLAPPLVITGLQRTGSTMLQRLLAADPHLRALASWEALNPAPLGPWPPAGPDPRLRLARLAERSMVLMAPDFFAIHPVEAEAPEEDSLLLDASFLSPVAEATLRVPGYSAWLQRQDHEPAYRHLALLLRFLLWQRPAPRWLLKTPAHLEHLDLLLRVFPGARIVQLHRDPAATLPSFCSMIAHGRGVFSDAVDPAEIGRTVLAQQTRLLRRAIAQRRDPRVNEAVLDIFYPELIADPLGQVARIYAHADLTLSPGLRRRMEGLRRQNRQHRHGRHRYRLESFGLGADELARAFDFYFQRFSVPREWAA